MAQLKPIVDYHGKEIEVEIIFTPGDGEKIQAVVAWREFVLVKSAGVFVYMDVGDEFARLTAGQARVLAARLTSAAEEAEGYAS